MGLVHALSNWYGKRQMNSSPPLYHSIRAFLLRYPSGSQFRALCAKGATLVLLYNPPTAEFWPMVALYQHILFKA